jgi:hypothetical protein
MFRRQDEGSLPIDMAMQGIDKNGLRADRPEGFSAHENMARMLLNTQGCWTSGMTGNRRRIEVGRSTRTAE